MKCNLTVNHTTHVAALNQIFIAMKDCTRLCWCYHHRCWEDRKLAFFVILNAVKDLLNAIIRLLFWRRRSFAIAQDDKALVEFNSSEHLWCYH